MDRRRFVASVALSPLAWRMQSVSRPGRRLPDDVLIIGVGSMGVAVVEFLDGLGVQLANRIALSGKRNAGLWEALRGPDGTVAARRYVAETLSGYREVPPTTVVTIALGELIESRLIDPLLEQLASVSSVHVVGLLPDMSRGSPCSSWAEQGLRAICRRAAGYSVIDEDARTRAAPWPHFSDGPCRLASATARALANPARRIADCSLPGEDFGWPGRREDVVVTLPRETTSDAPTRLVFTGLFLRSPSGYRAIVEGLYSASARGASLAEARGNLATAIVNALRSLRVVFGVTPHEAARNLKSCGRAVPSGQPVLWASVK